MSVIKQLTTLIKGSAREGAQEIIDANALRLLDEQIRDLSQALQTAKKELTLIVAQRIARERDIKHIEQQIEEHEGLARKALTNGRDDLAHEIATELANIERQHSARQQSVKQMQEHEQQTQHSLRQASELLQDLRHQAALVRATNHSQNAHQRLNRQGSELGDQFDNARQTLIRIQERQQAVTDHLAAHKLVTATSDTKDALHERLVASGLIKQGPDAQDILARLSASVTQREA